ncbi:hypothetical protein ACTWQB_08675 [Piscibacillus sp. B03]|uniref:hypothetical protein n=1 Tax=Piscibacillus sp. B03 TaxID=3457430 RepID=UPI003FCEE080
MKDWWERKKKKSRKHKKGREQYTFLDFILDIILWLPEVILLPLRMIFWLFRGITRNIFDTF